MMQKRRLRGSKLPTQRLRPEVGAPTQGGSPQAWGCTATCPLPSPLGGQRGVPPPAMAGSGAWWAVLVRPATLHRLRMDSSRPQVQVSAPAAMLTAQMRIRQMTRSCRRASAGSPGK